MLQSCADIGGNEKRRVLYSAWEKRFTSTQTKYTTFAKIADEAQGWDYGEYSWAYRHFKRSPKMIADIRALCYIVALQYQWDLQFCASDASYIELCQSSKTLALKTKEAWEVFVRAQTDENLKHLPPAGDTAKQGRLFDLKSVSDRLGFITDSRDREIVRDFISKNADVLLASDHHILRHKDKLAKLDIRVMRPADWLSDFLKDVIGNEDAVHFLERILFSVG